MYTAQKKEKTSAIWLFFCCFISSFRLCQTSVSSIYRTCYLYPEHCNNVLTHYYSSCCRHTDRLHLSEWCHDAGAEVSCNDTVSCKTRTADALVPLSRCFQPSPPSLCLHSLISSICDVQCSPGAILWWSVVIYFLFPLAKKSASTFTDFLR